MKKYDVIIIGGGAAGLCAAVSLKQKNSKLSVAVLEQLQRVGKKLITTGNGRCNILNSDISFDRFHSENPSFFEHALTMYDNSIIEDFFERLGVIFFYDEIGRAYPYSLQASSVVDALRFSAESIGVELITESVVTDIIFEKSGFGVVTEGISYSSSAVIIASGLLSGGSKLGSTGSILKILVDKGYRRIKTTPAIVQLKTATEIVRQLKGIKVNADVKLLKDNKAIAHEYGEVLFCDYGLSGPPIMHLSRPFSREKGEFSISLDLMPGYSFGALCEMLNTRAKALNQRKLDEFFTGMLNKRVGQVIIKQCGLSLGDAAVVLNNAAIKKLTALIKAFNFKVTDTTGFDNSQVTAGGLNTLDFNDKTMMSEIHRGLFAAGEILDVDGDCGGFNLKWAWASAMCAADGVISYLGGVK